MRTVLTCCVLLNLAAAGCQMRKPQKPAEYETIAIDPRRNTQAAQQQNAKAVLLIKEGKLEEAEKELKAALAADMFFGPAHNNLGTIYNRQKKFYLAAWEFQYAIKLMPNRAEAKNNLAEVFEAVGKLDEAAKWYEAALEIEPDTPEIIANTARVYVRANRTDTRTRELLHEVVLKDQRPQWVTWAREQLVMIGRTEPATPRSVETE